MQIWAVAMVRDEEDILERTIRHLFQQGVDHVLVADNLSSDGTRELLERLPVTVVDDPDPAYRQSEKMTALAERAAANGADWIIPFDADEIWRAKSGTLREAIESTEADVLVAEMFEGGRPNGWCKVAFRWQPGTIIAMGNHDVEGERNRAWGKLLIDHYPYRSWEQYRRKMKQGARAIELAGAPPLLGQHWRKFGAMPDWRLRVNWWLRKAR